MGCNGCEDQQATSFPQANWYELSTVAAEAAATQPDGPEATAAASAAPAAGGREGEPAGGGAAHEPPAARRSLEESCEVGSWTVAAVEGSKQPHPRYEHGVAALGLKMFVVGGNCGASVQGFWFKPSYL